MQTLTIDKPPRFHIKYMRKLRRKRRMARIRLRGWS